MRRFVKWLVGLIVSRPAPKKMGPEELSKFYSRLGKEMIEQGNDSEGGFLLCLAQCYQDPTYRFYAYRAISEVFNAQITGNRLFFYPYKHRDLVSQHHQEMLDYALKHEYYEVAASLMRNKEVWERM